MNQATAHARGAAPAAASREISIPVLVQPTRRLGGATPSSPNPFLTLGLAAVVGVILGLFVVFLRGAFRSSAA